MHAPRKPPHLSLLFWVVAALISGCGGASAPARTAPPDDSRGTPLNHVWWVATHNSYWADRGADDPFASGASLRLSDQLVVFGARAVEIDIHRSRTQAGADVCACHCNV